jgi:hypothetical protein
MIALRDFESAMTPNRIIDNPERIGARDDTRSRKMVAEHAAGTSNIERQPSNIE